MKYQIYYGNNERSKLLINEIKEIIEVFSILNNISELEIIEVNEDFLGRAKSISKALSSLLDEKFIQLKWDKSKLIFNDNNHEYRTERWTLDYYKNKVSVEVAFNHEEGTSWNILKGILANKSNNISKNIDINYSVIITATNDLMRTGGFDTAIGTYEKYIKYLVAFDDIVNYPIILIGLNGLEEFYIKHNNVVNKKIGTINKRGQNYVV